MTLRWQHSTDDIDWQELSELYRLAPLGEKEPERLRVAFGHSMFKCFVYEGDQMVAVGRAMADGCDVAYLCDIAVLPSHQGTGLGQHVVEWLLAQVAGYKKVILYAAPGKDTFYLRFGFLPMQTAMAIFENEEAALARGYLREV